MTLQTASIDRSDTRPPQAKRPTLLQQFARRLLRSRLERLRSGRLTLSEPDGETDFGRPAPGIAASRIEVHDPAFFPAVVFGGSIGAGEAYMDGLWSCDDLTRLARLLLRNRAVLDGMDDSGLRLAAPLQRLMSRLQRNTRSGSRRNIAAHYDLGNDFFELWLDRSMMYSSAIFERDDMTLAEASRAKLDRVCRKLELDPGDRVLEIGAGWGGFAIHAARHYGCHVTTTTISREQYDQAARRIADEDLGDRVTLLLEDYRDLSGRFDKLVSIEMIEAVGSRYFDQYFRKCSELLEEDGMMLLQAIVIADQRYERARRSIDFIQRYIFPGSCLPSVSVIMDKVARVTDLRLLHLEDIGPHYARTLRCWRERMQARIEQVRALGYPERFIRMWEFYLCYCEGAFLERVIGDVQMLLVKPGCRRRPILGGFAGSRRNDRLAPSAELTIRSEPWRS